MSNSGNGGGGGSAASGGAAAAAAAAAAAGGGKKVTNDRAREFRHLLRDSTNTLETTNNTLHDRINTGGACEGKPFEERFVSCSPRATVALLPCAPCCSGTLSCPISDERCYYVHLCAPPMRWRRWVQSPLVVRSSEALLLML
jgi:hypothetical protein